MFRYCDDREETISHLISKKEILRKESIRQNATGWEKMILNLSVRTNGICTSRNPPKKIRRKKFSRILRYKSITNSRQTNRHNDS